MTYTYRVWPDGTYEFEDDFSNKCDKYDDFAEVVFTEDEVDRINGDEDLLYSIFVEKGLC